MLKLSNDFLPFSEHRIRSSSSRQTFPAHEFPMTKSTTTVVRCCLNNSTSLQKLIGRIRERITNGKIEISPSAYDTAWVAMVPEKEYPGGGKKPSFPECLDWIIQNQNPDGSWGMDPGHPSLVKDSLSCTLACLIALRKWNVGYQQLHKGLEFIRANTSAARDKDQLSPIGFDIIFPTMITYANQLDLTLPFDQDLLDSMIHIRDSQINKSERDYMNLGYVAEGIGDSFAWNNIILTQQRSNGSLFNSPATTAAALVHHQGNKMCFQYLQSLLRTFKNWVPTVYPLEIHTSLCLVDTIQELGIERHFVSEVHSILEETYRLWQHKEEEIFADVNCCAIAFRLLRIKGFEVSSDGLAPYAEQDHVSLQTTGVITILELYRASQIRIHEKETTLDAINDWTTTFLKQQLLSETILDKNLQKKVEYELKNFHGTLGRVGNRRSLDLYDVDNYQVMKAAYRCSTIYNVDFLVFSRQDFNICQAIHQKEFQQLERWYKDCRLDSLNFGRDALHGAHFLASAIFGDPQLVDARMTFAKNVVLVARLDDFFDQRACGEESYKILELVKEWNEKQVEEYGSQEVQILFTALYRTVNELAEKAHAEQRRCVKHHLINLWVELLTSFVKELDSWYDSAATVNLDEYLSFARISIGSANCILPSIYFLGTKLSEEMIMGEECNSLCMHVGTIVRLLNDLRSSQKENEETRLNAVSIIVNDDEGKDEEMAISKIEKMIEYNRRKLLRIVYRRGTVLPRKCKDLFSDLCKMGYYLYSSGGGDEFTSPQLIIGDMRLLIHHPLKLPPS